MSRPSIPSPDPNPGSELNDLLDRVRTVGDEDAARTLYEKYRSSLLKVIRKKYLPPTSPLRSEFDSDDFLQETWQRVFGCVQKGWTAQAEADFIRLILAVATNHIHQRFRNRMAAKRSPEREEPLDPARHDSPSREPDPAEQAVADDELRRLLARVPEGERPLMRALRAGKPVHEVASEFGISERTLRRMQQRGLQE